MHAAATASCEWSAQGGFGMTYEAEDINLGTAVAIKEYTSTSATAIPPWRCVPGRTGIARPSTWGRLNFLQEARCAGGYTYSNAIAHPHPCSAAFA